MKRSKSYVLLILVMSCFTVLYKVKLIADERNAKKQDVILAILKEKTSNQIGIDVEDLAELLKEQKISPKALVKTIKKEFPVNVIQKKIATTVKTSDDLCEQEQEYLNVRLPKIEKILRKDFDVNMPLRIGFACSGGGNRAMIGTLGMLMAAARHKFLDVTLYLAGLSGSTWTIAPWSYMRLKGLFSSDVETSLQEFQEMLLGGLDYFCPVEVKACLPNGLEDQVHLSFSKNLAKHFAYGQRITVVDLYGAFIANYVLKKLGPDRLKIVWSSIAKDIKKGEIPLPLCSSVFDIKESPDHNAGFNADYRWFETGPFEAGSPALGFIPVWALGSTFEDGKLVSHAPEYEMSTLLGMYGSAFDLATTDFMDYKVPNPVFKVSRQNISLPVSDWMSNIVAITNKYIRSKQAENIHAQFANYSKGLPTSALKDIDQFGMFDGGNDFHIPLPLLFDRSQRAVDVAILYDSDAGRGASLIAASHYFKKVGIAMPDLEEAIMAFGSKEDDQQKGLLSKPMTVFNDPREKRYDSSLPTLIYFPTPKTDISQAPYFIDLSKYSDITKPIDNSKRPYFVANFQYTPADFKNLSQTMEAVFESQVPEMKKILKMVAQKRLREQ